MQELKKLMYSLFTLANLIFLSHSPNRSSKPCDKFERSESKQGYSIYSVYSSAKDFYLCPVLVIPHLGLFCPEIL